MLICHNVRKIISKFFKNSKIWKKLCETGLKPVICKSVFEIQERKKRFDKDADVVFVKIRYVEID